MTAITLTGTPPAGVTFTDHGDGTATLAGTPTAGPGPHALTFSATNGGAPVTQNFTLSGAAGGRDHQSNGTTFTAASPARSR